MSIILPRGSSLVVLMLLLSHQLVTSFQISRYAARNVEASQWGIERLPWRSQIQSNRSNHRFLKSSVLIRRQMVAETRERPEWACNWMPTWLITLRPLQQLAITFAFYLVHTFWMGRAFIALPYQLLPNNDGDFQLLGFDSLAGFAAMAAVMRLRNSTKDKQNPPIRKMWRLNLEEDSPWRFPQKNRAQTRLTAVIAFFVLTRFYFYSTHLAGTWEDIFSLLAAYEFPISVAMHRSLSVLMSHLSWVVMACGTLSLVVRPQPFFGGGKKLFANTKKAEKNIRQEGDWKPRRYRWFVNQWNTYWLGWVIGGYLVTCWLFNIAEYANRLLLPRFLLEGGIEGSVVTELTNPVDNDLLASLVGFLAPCVSAPWFEEILYRGYLLPALGLFMPFWPAVFFSGVIFSLTHLNWPGFIPLMTLGWTWAALYSMCGNLLVTILIHVMWNSRVFLSSWFGM